MFKLWNNDTQSFSVKTTQPLKTKSEFRQALDKVDGAVLMFLIF
jgi:hypothetical protein